MMEKNCALASGENPSNRLGDFANDRLHRRALLDLRQHALARELFDFRQLVEHLSALDGIGDVARDGRAEDGAEILRAVGEGCIGTDGDALHALGAVLGNVERSFAAGNVLGRGVAGGGGDDAHSGERRGRLVVAKVRAEFGVEDVH